jgi:hypothetical protein
VVDDKGAISTTPSERICYEASRGGACILLGSGGGDNFSMTLLRAAGNRRMHKNYSGDRPHIHLV